MATAKKTSKAKEWSHTEILAYTKGATRWKAQVSTAPNGQRFVGVRRFTVDAEGGETPDRQGINIKLSDDNNATVAKQLRMLSAMFAKVADHVEDNFMGDD